MAFMKSAYELAMERLEKQAPQVKLTDEQREKIAEIVKKFKAKIAEKEVFLNNLIAEATAEGRYEEIPQLKAQLASEVARLEQEMEDEKAKVHAESAS